MVPWATSGQHTLADRARLAGRARSTSQVWLGDFTAGGVARLLEREAPPGQPSPLAAAAVPTQLPAGRPAGQWRTAGPVAMWLKEKHGLERAPKALYYWLGKVTGWKKRAARSGFRVPVTSNRIRRRPQPCAPN